jgi:probable phosphoglycerate mutase
VQLLLVRHGQSTWNALGRWQGTENPPLSDLGVAQGKAAGRALAGLGHDVDAVWTSDLQRAARTAELLAIGLGLGAVTKVAELRERFAGPWQGHTRAEIEDGWPGWLGEGRRPDDFEADDALLERAVGGIRRVAETCGAELAVAVTHAGILMSLDRLAGEGPHRFPNLGGRWFEVTDDGLVGGERVELVPEGVDLGVE